MTWRVDKKHPSYNDLKVVRRPWGIRIRIRPGYWITIEGPSFMKFKREAKLQDDEGHEIKEGK